MDLIGFRGGVATVKRVRKCISYQKLRLIPVTVKTACTIIITTEILRALTIKLTQARARTRAMAMARDRAMARTTDRPRLRARAMVSSRARARARASECVYV